MGEQQKMTLAEEVVKLLEENELTVTTAESCTCLLYTSDRWHYESGA